MGGTHNRSPTTKTRWPRVNITATRGLKEHAEITASPQRSTMSMTAQQKCPSRPRHALANSERQAHRSRRRQGRIRQLHGTTPWHQPHPSIDGVGTELLPSYEIHISEALTVGGAQAQQIRATHCDQRVGTESAPETPEQKMTGPNTLSTTHSKSTQLAPCFSPILIPSPVKRSPLVARKCSKSGRHCEQRVGTKSTPKTPERK